MQLFARRAYSCARLRVRSRAPGIANQGNQGFRLHGVKFFFFKHTGDQFAGFAVTIFHGVDQRQRDFAFLQIAQHRLSELLAGSREIQQIINQLKRQPA